MTTPGPSATGGTPSVAVPAYGASPVTVSTETPVVTEPAPVGMGWIVRFAALIFGVNVAWSAPAQLLIANQILQWYPHSKEVRLGWLMAAGGLVSMVASPLAGWLSDRGAARSGTRTSWVSVGVVTTAVLLVAAAFAGGYWSLFAVWAGLQVTLAIAVTVTQAIAPDEVPQRQFGLVSGVMGLMYTLAVVAGSLIGGLLPIRDAYLASAGLHVLACAPFLVSARRRRGAGAGRGRGLREAAAAQTAGLMQAAALTVPAPTSPPGRPPRADYHDARWVFIARALVTVAQSLSLFYLLYFLRDRVHLRDPDAGVVTLSAVYAGCVIVTAVFAGWFSDRVGRRKIFVSASSMGVAVAAVIMAFTTSWPVIVALAAGIGVSWGVYQAIDQALMNEALPDADARGRDLGVLQLAVAVPNTLSPVMAAFIVTTMGGYSALYLTAAAFTTLGGLVVWKVRGSR